MKSYNKPFTRFLP